MIDCWVKVICWSFLDLSKGNFSFEVILFVCKGDCIDSFWSQTTNKGSRVHLFIECSINFISIRKLVDFISFVNQLHWVQASMCWEIVASIISVGIFWSYAQEVTDWRMMRNLFTVDLCSIWIGALQCLSYHRIERFQEHWDVVKSWYCICYDVLEPFYWILSLVCFLHEVGVHATWHCWVFKSCSRHHDFNREGDSSQVEISADDFFANNFDHFFPNRSYLVYLHFIRTIFSSFGMRILMPMFVIIRKKPLLQKVDLKADIIYCASSGDGVMKPS